MLFNKQPSESQTLQAANGLELKVSGESSPEVHESNRMSAAESHLSHADSKGFVIPETNHKLSANSRADSQFVSNLLVIHSKLTRRLFSASRFLGCGQLENDPNASKRIRIRLD